MAIRFRGVVTTGVYCQAGCPAQPREENVRGYDFAAAAEADGFRPCLRCRPDTAPPSPDWVAPSELVCRALHLIDRGALDDGHVDALARRVGVGDRHLRRLFDTYVGASPVAIARSRRAHFARRLLDETDLPVARIAFASGFNSIRQLNRTMTEVFRLSPTELRRRRRRRDLLPTDGGLAVRLPYRPPLAWAQMLTVLAARAIPGVEVVGRDRYRRTIEVNGEAGVLELRPEPRSAHLVCTLHLRDVAGLIHLVEQARRILDLGADGRVIDRALGRDPRLRPLVQATPGLRVPGAWDPFEVAVRAVLGQQVSVAAASRLAGRVVAAFGSPVALDGEERTLTHVFPSPATLAEADLAAPGMPASRANAVRGVAAAVAGGELALDGARGLDALVTDLVRLPGIGPWTAHYIAMRACGEPDAFPVGDLGLRRAAADGFDAPLTPEALADRAEAWRPWRAYAAMHLWMSGSGQTDEPEEGRTPAWNPQSHSNPRPPSLPTRRRRLPSRRSTHRSVR